MKVIFKPKEHANKMLTPIEICRLCRFYRIYNTANKDVCSICTNKPKEKSDVIITK